MQRNVVKFAEEIIRMYWEGDCADLDGEAVQTLAVSYGLVEYRKPRPSEMADPEWWGHEFSMGPDDVGVGEFSREFCAMMKEHKTDEICLAPVLE